MSFDQDDGTQLLLPSVAADGSRILTPKETLEQYQRTGQHLGVFAGPQSSDAYAQSLHEEQAQQYLPQPGPP
jgi:hypothetical protein